MINYYELLKLASNASSAEIEERLDDQYAKWRSLVTHHDVNIVSQANQALNQLEEIRNTLMNSEKRNEYDRFLAQAQGTMAGLADPDVLIAQNPVNRVMAPPRPSNIHFPASEQKEVERTDAWICTDPKCKKANPTGTQFCAKCGKRIGVKCPNCNSLVEFSNKFCSNCGVNKEDNFKKLQSELLTDQQKRLLALQTELQDGQTDYTSIIRAHPELNKTAGSSCIGGLFGIGALMLSAIVGFSTESWAAFFIVLIILIGVFSLLSSIKVISNRKKSVSEYINGQLIPQIASTKEEISRIQNVKYGDESSMIQDDYNQPWGD